MRRILLSTLFLSSVLVHAQTSTPAQGVTLEARNSATNALAASTDASIPTGRRISTGVTFPKLISAPSVSVLSTDFPTANLAAQHVVVGFRVDENGAPQNVHLVKSVNQSVDERVLAAVRQYRFAPGTLDNQTVAVDVNLVVNFQQK
ncbi:MAG TPA: TonB family protein [Terracidiphilus sp.]|jgi:TonB family protein|nr:TonB family protein [Terracidiphilus sp.]